MRLKVSTLFTKLIENSNIVLIMENSIQSVSGKMESPLKFKILAECSTSKARTSLMELPHHTVELPMFMPVGTQGAMKGLLPEQVKNAGAQIILGNTYHLGTRPGPDLLEKMGGLHHFMQWDRALLTDSGGFQMVSLLKLAQITEDGVKFQSPFDSSECMLTPEESIHIQNSIGADIMMQLDDVVDVRETDYERFKVATERTTRWLDRCIKSNKNPDTQCLFPIVQGGLFPDLRKKSLEMLIARDASGYAIGGLSGGEDKNKFWPTVDLCTDHLPKEKPRYCMGVGFPVDLVVCCALGVDMFDCVYPTRTARFGCALVNGGQINLKSKQYRFDFSPIDDRCECSTCANYTRAYINTIVTKETIACHLVSIHNIAYLMKLMKNIRESIKKGQFVKFVQDFMKMQFKDEIYPQWVIEALSRVNISLTEKESQRIISEQLKTAAAKNCVEDLWDEFVDDKVHLSRMSDFERRGYESGYREGILDDYDEAEQNGRVYGYKAALSLSGITKEESHFKDTQPQAQTLGSPCDVNHPETVSSLKSSETLKIANPMWIISQWMGILTACQSQKNLTETETLELTRLKTKLGELATQYTSTINKLANDRSDYQSTGDTVLTKDNILETYSNVTNVDILPCTMKCKSFCDIVGWKYPNNI